MATRPLAFLPLSKTSLIITSASAPPSPPPTPSPNPRPRGPPWHRPRPPRRCWCRSRTGPSPWRQSSPPTCSAARAPRSPSPPSSPGPQPSRGVKLAADALIVDLADAEFDLISLPGGMPGAATFRDCKVLENMVKNHAQKGKLYAAICAAPAVALGTWGLLNGLKATCYPSFMDKLPSEVNAVESRVQIDGKCVTSRGPGTAMEYSVVLVEQLYGKEKAEEVAGPMVMRPQHGVEFAMKELNATSWNVGETPQILVPIANGTEEMEATMIIDVLRRAKANVVVASLEDKLEIVASRKVKMVADVLLDEAIKQQYDLILLPGGLGGAEAYSKSDKLMGLIKKQAEANKLYGAICASPAIALEPHGLLKGKKATSYPAMWNKLADQSECNNRVVVDGNLITSQGPGTSIEFSLAIVEKLLGREKALELAKTLVFV